MGSTRLPGKTLADIEGRPMLWHLVDRLNRCARIDGIVIATTTSAADDAIVAFAEEAGIGVYRGSEEDVLDRFYRAALPVRPDAVLRATPDCPLLPVEVVDKVLDAFLDTGADYASNVVAYTYPDGCDVEVFTFTALERAWREATDPVDREHVTPYIRRHARVADVRSERPVDPDRFKWSVDRPEDLAFVRAVYRHLYRPGDVFSMDDVFRLLEEDPDIMEINRGSVVNEGFYRTLLDSEPVPPRQLEFTESEKWKKRAARVVPGGTQTFSKGPTQFVGDVTPAFVRRGSGCKLWDVDGNEFTDFAMALGPVILGYGHPAVVAAAQAALADGAVFSLPHPAEVELSETLAEIVPCAEMVRFGKNGSDATSGAVRVARAFTGRDKIACCGYHGWQDWYIATTTMNRGIPGAVRDLTMTFTYNDLDSLKALFDRNPGEIAAVVMEPVGVVEPEPGFLEGVREMARANGALLVFDEVVTGFRVALGGAQSHYGVTPDLACLGKAMGNGMPVAAVVGRADVMRLFEQEVFFSFTFGGDVAALSAALATIGVIRSEPVIAHLWEQGRRLRDGYNVLSREIGVDGRTSAVGLPPRTVVTFTDEAGAVDLQLKSLFQQECVKRGVLFTGGHNISYGHSAADIDQTLRVYRTVLAITAEAIATGRVDELLEGEPVRPVFRNA